MKPILPLIRLAAATLLAVLCGSFASAQEKAKGAEPAKEAAPKDGAPKEAPAKAEAPVVAEPGPFDKPGFVTREVKGRVWVLRSGSKELAEFLKSGESAKSITLIGRGPNGMSLRAPDKETAEAYLAAP